MHKLLCKSKDRVATEEKNIVYEIDCGNCKAVYFGESTVFSHVQMNISTNNYSLSQSQQQMQATDIQEEEIRISINLPYIEGTREKLGSKLRSRILH